MFNGGRVRALRRERGIGIEMLAAAAGVSPTTVRTAESGLRRPSAKSINALARTLGVTTEHLTCCPDIPTLRDVRDALGLTQTQLAERAGRSRQVVSRLERGIGGNTPGPWPDAYDLTPQQWVAVHQATREAARCRLPEPSAPGRGADA